MWKSSSEMLVNPRVVFTFTRQRWSSTTFSSLLTFYVWTSNIFSHLSALYFPYLQHYILYMHTQYILYRVYIFFDMTVFSLESRKPLIWQKHLWIRHLTHTCYWHLYIQYVIIHALGIVKYIFGKTDYRFSGCRNWF